jgi:restriction system protein
MDFKELRQNRIPHVIWKIRPGSGFIWKPYKQELGGQQVAQSWREYQEEAVAFFRSVGLEAETDARVSGVRTHHDVDVLVRSHHVGFDVVWIVECKQWQSRVSKLHVLALREIVTDIGADRGILVSEKGFQSGAIEAAALTNVRVTSLEVLRQTASADISAMRLRELYDRTSVCRERYWDIPKNERIRPRPSSGSTSGGLLWRSCRRTGRRSIGESLSGSVPD